MRTKSIIGQRIVKISQSPVRLTDGKVYITVDAITLENGVVLVTHAHHTHDEPVGTLLIATPSKTAPFLRVTPNTGRRKPAGHGAIGGMPDER